MLLNVPSILSPQLLEVLAEMRHGDIIVLGDANFPSASVAKCGNTKLVRADGLQIPELLDAILTMIPLDTYTDTPILLMEKLERDIEVETPVWEKYEEIVTTHQKSSKSSIGYLTRDQFYKVSKDAYCNVQTGETATYANVLIKKGIVLNTK